MSFLDAIRAVSREYFVLFGRARRAELWWWMVFAALATAALIGLGAVTADTSLSILAAARRPFAIVAATALLVPTVTVMVRRLHDVGWSGRWLLVAPLATFAIRMALSSAEEEGPDWWTAYSEAESLGAKLSAAPGWLLALAAVAAVSALLVVALLALPGRAGLNRFDAPPPQPVVDRSSAWALIMPFLVLMLIFNIWVFARGFHLSLTDAESINEGDYVGLQNYANALWASKLKAPAFWKAFRVTAIYTVGGLVTQLPVAFVLAYVLNTLPFLRIRAVLRAAFFLPCLINTVTIALLFRMFFNKDTGILNHTLATLGLPSQTDWLMHSQWAVPLMIAVSFWQWTGFHMVYFLAQLQTIDPTLYEAAKMDGISPSGQLRHITLPLMRPAITFVAVTSAIGGLQTFDLVFVLFPNSSYGPGGVAKTLVALIYDEAWRSDHLVGYASAVGWLTFLIIAGVSLLQIRFLGLGKHGEA